MYVEEESGGITERAWLKEYTDGLVVVRETATAMACMRLVKRNVVVHFWPFLNAKFISLRSGFTSLSMVLSDDLPFALLTPFWFLGKVFGFAEKIGTGIWGLSVSMQARKRRCMLRCCF